MKAPFKKYIVIFDDKNFENSTRVMGIHGLKMRNKIQGNGKTTFIQIIIYQEFSVGPLKERERLEAFKITLNAMRHLQSEFTFKGGLSGFLNRESHCTRYQAIKF